MVIKRRQNIMNMTFYRVYFGPSTLKEYELLEVPNPYSLYQGDEDEA
jgi:hypothetical protein